ncbi:MAG: pyridoxamine 5'-phosphate oxidase family protein [Candidatus Tectimicrobiota bacterium]
MLTSAAVLAVIRETLAQVEFCFLITLGVSGQANARLMQPFAPEADLSLWLGTSPASRKVLDIRREPRVTLAFHQAPVPAYVTCQGTAEIVADLATRQRYWREDWRAFFPDGPSGEGYGLLRVVPQRFEVLHFPQQITPAPFGLCPAVLLRAGEQWELGVA